MCLLKKNIFVDIVGAYPFQGVEIRRRGLGWVILGVAVVSRGDVVSTITTRINVGLRLLIFETSAAPYGLYSSAYVY